MMREIRMNTTELPQGYFGDNMRKPSTSIVSEWTPTEIAECTIDASTSRRSNDIATKSEIVVSEGYVPAAYPAPTLSLGPTWPSHWPGNHSPLIMRAVMETGEINGKQIIDPRDRMMKLKLNLRQSTQHMEMAKTLSARYSQLYETLQSNLRFTNTDKTLVNIIVGKINAQITVAEKQIEEDKAKGGYKDLAEEQEGMAEPRGTSNGWTTFVIKVTSLTTGALIREKWYAAHPQKYGRAPQGPNGEALHVATQLEVPAAIQKRIQDYDAKFATTGKYVSYNQQIHGDLLQSYPTPSGYKAFDIYVKARSDGKFNINYFYDGKLHLSANNQSSRPNLVSLVAYLNNNYFNGETLKQSGINITEEGHPTVLYATGGRGGYMSLGGHYRTPKMARRNGTLMGFGAMQAHDRLRSTTDRDMTPYERRSLLQARREMTLQRARQGSRIEVNQEMRNQPVTRPWPIQVTLSSAQINKFSSEMEARLSVIGLSQVMFTQQAHNYIASALNMMTRDEAVNSSELVIEKILANVLNNSGLLNKDVQVNLKTLEHPPVEFSEKLSGLGSGLLKTRAAMGRLLR
jgi:hypothetical protein